MYARLRCSGNLPLCLAFGTGEGLLRYGICVPCSKRLPGGTRRIFGSIRCKKQASTVQKRYSVHKTGSCGTRRISKGPQNSRLHRLWTASCPPDAFSEACRAKSSTCRTGRIFSARNGPRSEVSGHKKRPTLFGRPPRKVILIYRRHGRHTVNFVSSFVEKREMLTLTSSLSGER